jgi:two-component system chemotaxis sensor kinase CheA
VSTLDPVLQIFLREGSEQVESLDAALLRLELKANDRAVLQELMRTAHNLKGGAGTAGQRGVAELAHLFEDAIARLLDGALDAGPETFDHLFAACDALAASMEEIGAGTDPCATLAPANQALAELLGMHVAPAAAPAKPTTDPLADFALGELGHVRLKVFKQQNKRMLRIDTRVPESEHDAEHWSYAFLSALRRVVTVVSTKPSEVELCTLCPRANLAVLAGSYLTAPQAHDAICGEFAIEPDAISVAEVQCADTATVSVITAAPSASADKSNNRRSMRVDTARVDALVDLIGELVTTQTMVANATESASQRDQRLDALVNQLGRLTRDLQDTGLRLRMVPLAGVFQMMARAVRDLGRKRQKEVTLTLVGEDVEMDRAMVERLTDPLLHLVRNAVDHGVEPPDERVRFGKTRTAQVRLCAFHQGSSIVVEVGDDGRGIDPFAVTQKAAALGLAKPGTALSEEEIHELIFQSGFSTAAELTDVSGRGVGLDIVRQNVLAMRGRVRVRSSKGVGTTFQITLPTTLAIIDGMLVACGSERYIIPTTAIAESIRPSADTVHTLAGRLQMVTLRDQTLPVVPLGDALGIAEACREPSQGLVVVVESAGRRLGLLVDGVITQQQVVKKSLGAGLEQARFLAGAAILADGKVGLILDIDELINHNVGRKSVSQQDHPDAADKTATADAATITAAGEVTRERGDSWR